MDLQTPIPAFLFFRSYRDAFRLLPDGDQLLLLHALLDYVFDQTVPTLPPQLEGLFILMRPTLDESMQNYASQNARKKRAKNAQNAPSNKDKDKDTDTKAQFERFWDAYPRKADKARARPAFDKALQKIPLDTMLAALEAQKQSHDWQKDDGQFVPYPSSWLNGCRWEDEPAQPVCQTALQPEILPAYEEDTP